MTRSLHQATLESDYPSQFRSGFAGVTRVTYVLQETPSKAGNPEAVGSTFDTRKPGHIIVSFPDVKPTTSDNDDISSVYSPKASGNQSVRGGQ